ncbi:MAG: putative quinol monooxygenase [Negativicutes bacterium]|nr:putative quinol monooxygenase [Negativicutes bacterium]
MIVVMATLSVKPGKKAELLALAKDVIATTRKEEGCVSYVLLDNSYDPGCCIFVEEWTDKEALRKHSASPHIAKWRQESAEFLTGKAVKLYQGEETSL